MQDIKFNLPLKTLDDESEGEKTEINIICPQCKKKKKVFIPHGIMRRDKGITDISIPPNVICEHTFIIHVDTNFSIRCYTKTDYTLDEKCSSIDTKAKEKEKLMQLSTFKNQMDNIIGIITIDINGEPIAHIMPKDCNIPNIASSFFELYTISNTMANFQLKTLVESMIIQLKKGILCIYSREDLLLCILAKKNANLGLISIQSERFLQEII